MLLNEIAQLMEREKSEMFFLSLGSNKHTQESLTTYYLFPLIYEERLSPPTAKSTENLSWSRFILNRGLPHYDAELFIWGFYNYYILFLMKIAYKISYSQQITLKALSYFVGLGIFFLTNENLNT